MSAIIFTHEAGRMYYLLITNRELALGLLVRIGESLKFLDRLRLQDLDAELDVAFRVFVAGLVIS